MKWERVAVTAVLVAVAVMVTCAVSLIPANHRIAALSAENAALTKQLAQANNDINRARQDLVDLHKSHSDIARKLKDTDALIAGLIREGIDAKLLQRAAMPPDKVPDVRTKVVDVRAKTGHVALGAGKDSKVREGHLFIIERGGKYVGKVRVTTIWKNFSGGTIIERKAPIKAGDDARTQVDVKKPKKVPEKKAKPKAAPEEKPPEAF